MLLLEVLDLACAMLYKIEDFAHVISVTIEIA